MIDTQINEIKLRLNILAQRLDNLELVTNTIIQNQLAIYKILDKTENTQVLHEDLAEILKILKDRNGCSEL
ncbi:MULTISPECIES: hypothetical protein [Calothrix]|uniref:Uncharacterized protein n=2 Tax=Calothrix TaxID=1186 RepID=A0ABR8A547_9CYAN|nr:MULTISPECIES: hypothetical protein [Calothrix]MBD2194453.1 hypothetical protein [Calothrix parietina FACHB-288]MBD2223235.1 hypothetical protein [Calothrix anomala FACHB-343]